MRHLFLLLSLLVCLGSNARRISEQEAYSKAQDFMQGKKFQQDSRVIRKSKGVPSTRNFYIFNVEDHNGFVIVSGDDRTRSILAFANKGELDVDRIPCNVKWILDNYDKEISSLSPYDDSFPSEFKSESQEKNDEISILIDTQWGQGEPYNLNCPIYQGNRCLTGCVATAMAQVINHHRWPQEQTSEVAGYTSSTNKISVPTLSPRSFDWNNMSESAVSQLMLYCGQAVQMDYDPNASGAVSSLVPSAMTDVFGYSKAISFLQRNEYSSEEWNKIVYGELVKGLPVLYFGQSPSDGGHAFIVDGYMNGMYHINWGWEGFCDGYFTLDSLNPFTDNGFNDNQEMVVNICPPAGIDELDRPKIIIREVRCSENEITRQSSNDAFPSFTIGSYLVSDVKSDISQHIGLALYDENGLVKTLSQSINDFSPNQPVTIENEITIPSEIPQGEYRIVSVSRQNEEDEWMANIGSTSVFIKVIVEELSAKLETHPLSDVGNDYIEYGNHLIDGIMYRLYSEFGNLRANILALPNEGNYSGDMYIPDYVNYQNMRFDIFAVESSSENLFWGNDDIISISIPGLFIPVSISSCPNLQSIELREGVGTSPNIYDCPRLSSILFPSTCNHISLINSCDNLSELFFNSKNTMTIEAEWTGELWSKETLPSLTDVYFTGENPPALISYSSEIIPNTDVSIHVPIGLADTYRCTEWKEWNIIEDQPSLPVNVKWDYCGNNDVAGAGIVVGCGNNDMEFAMRIPSEYISPYKDCKITAIEYFTIPRSINDFRFEDVEYVFITEPGQDYLVKEPAKTSRGNWTRIELSSPYSISGEDIFVGIGKHGNLSVAWAGEESVDDGMWARNMGTDTDPYLFAPPGTWLKHVGDDRFNHPLPIRAIIEGENLPTDIVLVSAEVSMKEPIPTYSSQKVVSPTLSELKSLVSSNGYFVAEKDNNNSPLLTNSDNSRIVESPKKVSSSQDKIDIRLRNRSAHMVKNVTLVWDIDGEEQTPQLISSGIPKNYDHTLSVDLPSDLSGRLHSINLSISDIDGNPDEIKINSDVERFITSSPSTYYPRKIVMEEAAGSWCGYCPMGIVTIEKMKEQYPDNFIAIAVHDDEMSPSDNSYDSFFESVSVVPSARVNRTRWQEVYPFSLDDVKDRAEAYIKASASFGNDRKVNVSTDTKFGFSDKNSDPYRIAYVLLEDNVGPYFQTNYYSDPLSPNNPDNLLDWWGHQGDRVLTRFNEVARGIYDYEGIQGLFPVSIVENETYHSDYAIDLPNGIQDASNLKVVTLLLDSRTGEILNADNTDIDGEVPDLSAKLGDSNGNGVINIADAVNIANYVVGNPVEHFELSASDVNADGNITFSDASATITLILEQPIPSQSNSVQDRLRIQNDVQDMLRVDNYSLSTSGTESVGIAIDGSRNYVALQLDVLIPEGMVIEDIRPGKTLRDTHSFRSHRIDNRTIRVILFSPENKPIGKADENILELSGCMVGECSGDIRLSNIVASDALAKEFTLAVIGGHLEDATGIVCLSDKHVEVSSDAGVLNISNARGKTIIVSNTDGRIVSSFCGRTDFERVRVSSGFYIVTVGNNSYKVIVK